MPGNHSPLHGQHHLDQSGDPGGGLEVADVGLHRADQQGAVRLASLAVGGRRGLELDRVSHLRPRAVRLQVVHLRRQDPRTGQGVPDHALLRGRARHRQPGGRPVLVDRRAADHPPDAVAVRLRLVQVLEDHDPAAFTPHVPVGRGVEGLAAPVGRQHARLAAQLREPSGQDQVNAPGQGEIRFPPLQGGDRLVYGHQRGRAGGVQGHRRSLQIEGEGDPSDGGVEGGSADRIEAVRRLGDLPSGQDQTAVVVIADPGIDPRAAALQAVRIDPRVLQGPPARLQHQPLLRVQQVRLDRGDPEEGGVEEVDPIEEATEPAGLALNLGVGEELSEAPDPGARDDLDHPVLPGFEETPERREVLRLGKSACHANDCNGLGGSALGCRHAALPVCVRKVPEYAGRYYTQEMARRPSLLAAPENRALE